MKRESEMKKKLFDFAIGNPPYQADSNADGNKNYAAPVYNIFMDGAADIAQKTELIHPARFLFDAGSTPKDWNRKMLQDPHFKVLQYIPDGKTVFPGTDIKGGIAITYRDSGSYFGPIKHFIAQDELRSIFKKVQQTEPESLSEIIYAAESYRFTDKMHKDHPEVESMLSDGHKYDLKTSVLKVLDNIIFFDERPADSHDYVGIWGLVKNNRRCKWIRKEYIKPAENFESYKVLVPKANGSGALGEVLSTPLIGTPLIGTPLIGHTQSFISIGKLACDDEAENLMKYIKSKFARCILGILKVTQDNPGPKWKYVPLQDFTASSDIDWSKSIHDIDQQLYRKYGLSDEEIDFIETHVKEMN